MIQALRPVAAAVVLAGCVELPVALPPPSATGPAPDLAPTTLFEPPLAAAGPLAVELGAATRALADRARDLRARAARLDGPVVDPATRSRLEAATAAATPD